MFVYFGSLHSFLSFHDIRRQIVNNITTRTLLMSINLCLSESISYHFHRKFQHLCTCAVRFLKFQDECLIWFIESNSYQSILDCFLYELKGKEENQTLCIKLLPQTLHSRRSIVVLSRQAPDILRSMFSIISYSTTKSTIVSLGVPSEELSEAAEAFQPFLEYTLH